MTQAFNLSKLLIKKSLNNLAVMVTYGVSFDIISKVVANFHHVGGSFNLFMATTKDVCKILSFLI